MEALIGKAEIRKAESRNRKVESSSFTAPTKERHSVERIPNRSLSCIGAQYSGLSSKSPIFCFLFSDFPIFCFLFKRWMEFQVPVISLSRSQVPLLGAGDQVGCAVRPVVQRGWVEIRAIGPNQRVDFGVDADLVE